MELSGSLWRVSFAWIGFAAPSIYSEQASSDLEIDPEQGKHAATRLERKFEEVKDRSLKELLPVVKGLMQFKPEDRISAAQALEMVRGIEREYGEE